MWRTRSADCIDGGRGSQFLSFVGGHPHDRDALLPELLAFWWNRSHEIEALATRLNWILVAPFLAVLVVNASPWPRGQMLAMTVIGMLFVGIGAIGRSWSLAYIAGRKTYELVARGPYTLCRNPLYLFSAIAAVGYGLLSGSLIVTGGIMVPFWCYYHFLIREEEAFLRSRFGATYEDYCRRVNRFSPSLRSWHDEAELTLDTRVFRERMFDHIWIIAFAGVLIALCQLHLIWASLTLCHLP